MDVSCPACAAKYTADEEKLRGKTARMRCKACNTAWLVSGPGASAAASPVSMMPPAGSIPPPASIPPGSSDSDKRAAVMKTGNEREKRDLFAEREPDVGSIKVKDTLLPPPAFGFTGTASRNENSVLFRVDQLANVGGRIKTPEPERFDNVNIVKASETRGGDEEGVIDLKALASVPPGKRSMIPVAPLFSEPPPMTMEVGTSGSRPAIAKPISKAKLFGAIAAAAAFLVVAGLGLSVAFKGEEAVHRTAAVAPPPPAPVVSAAPAPTVDPAPAASTASTDDSDQPKKKKGKRKGGKGAGNASASTAQTPAQKKAADPCGCKGDFNCILACTAKNGK